MDVPIFTSYCAVLMIAFLYGRVLQSPISKHLPSTNHVLTRFHISISLSPSCFLDIHVALSCPLVVDLLHGFLIYVSLFLAIDKYFSSLPFSFSFRISTSLSTDCPRRAPRCCSTCSTTTSTFSECWLRELRLVCSRCSRFSARVFLYVLCLPIRRLVPGFWLTDATFNWK